VLSFVKFVLFPLLSLKNISTFVIKRPEKFGGDISFNNYEEVEKSFVDRTLFPADLKSGVTDALNALLEPIRQKFTSQELINLTNKAYPEASKAKNQIRFSLTDVLRKKQHLLFIL
jgi:tyrosyl-tRNA synthetase